MTPCESAIRAFVPILAGALLLASTPPVATPRGGVERVTSELVLIAAYVTNDRGEPLRGLRSENFVLLVDGKPATIASLEFHELPPAVSPAEAGASVAVGLTEPVSPAPEPRLFVLYFEDDVSSAEGLTMARRAATQFLRTRLDPSDQVSIVAHARRLRVLSDFTADHEALARIVKSSLDDRSRVSDFPFLLHQQEEAVREALRRAEGPDKVSRSLDKARTSLDTAKFLITTYAAEDAARAARSLQALRSVVDTLSPRRGYKAVIYMGEGISDVPARYLLDRMSDIRALAEDPEVERRSQRADLAVEFRALLDAAGAGGVTIDTIETTGLSASDASTTPSSSVGRASSHRSSSLETLALNTGGVSSSSNDPLKGLADSESAGRAYYLIGYAPEGPPDGRTHTVQLRLTKTGGRLIWRREFVRLRPDEVRERSLRAAHLLPEMYRNLGLDLSVIPGPLEETGRAIDLVVHVPPGQILFLPGESAPTADLEIGFLAIDDRLKETLRLARNVRITLKDDLREPSAIGFDLYHRIRLPASEQDMRVVVDDLATGSIGAARATLPAVSVGEPGSMGLSIYSLSEKSVWVDVGERKGESERAEIADDYRIGPALKRTFSVGEPLACGFRPPGPPGLVPGVFRIAIGQRGRTLKIVNVAAEAGSGTVTTVLPMDGLAPGDYTLAVQEMVSGKPIDRATTSFRLDSGSS